MPVIFRVWGGGAFGFEHAVLFITQHLNPKPLINQSKFVLLINKAEEIFTFPFSSSELVGRTHLEGRAYYLLRG